jgi:predicted DNA-binding transcriptional regulator AlpA
LTDIELSGQVPSALGPAAHQVEPTTMPDSLTLSTEKLISRRQLAEQLGVCERTLERWAAQQIGPPRVRIGYKVYYRASALAAWLREREQ